MKDLDIKDLWKQGDAKEVGTFSVSQIQDMIRKGSDSLIHRFIKTLTIELWINLVILTLLSGSLLYLSEWEVGGVAMILNILFWLYYKNLIGNLKREEIDSTVLAHLYVIQKMVKRFILHYKIATLVMSLIAVSAVFYLENNAFYYMFSEKPKATAIGMACGFVFAVPLSLYLIHILYGKKAKKLADMIDSLEKEED
ncbi:hypothetical protein SAMN04488029_1678 [Reichenbachiella faecimaris]|uniref:Uncharacterized protein n=1 Tax=Reichenbachiella faecimaris TaxID=692418 RepID=A0A1W2GBZ8_REIFA|nr:hypothetical protein [Reichenbachiella faecimaris]SMD33806.1 hypothetical protein SAMN04488029_1678 [Reichenbachiella faecimaris]